MQRCKYCEKEYQPQRASSKFCSNNCRTRNYLKNGKPQKEAITGLQMQVMYNAIMDKLGGFSGFIQPDLTKPHVSFLNITAQTLLEPQQRQIKRTPTHWV